MNIHEEIQRLMERRDPRTISQMKAADEVTEGVVAKVWKSEDGISFEIANGIGMSLGKDSIPKDADIAIGARVRIYGGMGQMVHGLDVDGVEWYWYTPWERAAHRVKMLAKSDRDKRLEFEREREQRDRDFAALPPIFQERIRRRRHNNPEFQIEYEPYEVFCCQQAVVIAEAAAKAVPAGENTNEVDEFWSSGRKPHDAYGESWKEPQEPVLRWLYWWRALNTKAYNYDFQHQREVLPALSEEHSGNTFDAAFALAVLYLTQPEDVPKMYGALAPLVGSETYGDVDEARREPVDHP